MFSGNCTVEEDGVAPGNNHLQEFANDDDCPLKDMQSFKHKLVCEGVKDAIGVS